MDYQFIRRLPVFCLHEVNPHAAACQYYIYVSHQYTNSAESDLDLVKSLASQYRQEITLFLRRQCFSGVQDL